MKGKDTEYCIKVMQAYVEGKQIQYKDDEVWIDIKYPDWDWNNWEYRIKPEPNFRPFINVEECWQQMQKHPPFGWIKDKEDGYYYMVTTVDAAEGSKYISISGNNIWSLEDTMSEFTFADGAPFGIELLIKVY